MRQNKEKRIREHIRTFDRHQREQKEVTKKAKNQHEYGQREYNNEMEDIGHTHTETNKKSLFGWSFLTHSLLFPSINESQENIVAFGL